MKIRFAIVITLYKKSGKQTENIISQRIVSADNKEDAILIAMRHENICSYVSDKFKIFWKVATEIPEFNTETNKYELRSELTK